MNSTEDTVLEAFLDFLDAVEAGIANARRTISQVKGVTAVKEETFHILKWEKKEGSRIGEFEVAYEKNNLPDKWTSPHNILRKNNATINNRYYGDGYLHTYWLFGERKIYRQKRKPK